MANKSKIPHEQIEAILQLYKDGNSFRQIQRLTKTMTLPTIHRIIKAHTLTPEQLDAKKHKSDVAKRLSDANELAVKRINEATTKAMETIATTQAIKEKEDATSSAFTEEFQKTKAEMKQLLSLANTNHKKSVTMVSKILAIVEGKLEKYGDSMSVADNKRVMEILDLGADVMAKLFNTLGFDIRNELIQLSMRKADEKNKPILQIVNSKGEVVDIYQTDYVTNERM